MTYVPLQDRAYERFLLLYETQDAGEPLLKSDADILAAGVTFTHGDITPAGGFAESGTGLNTGRYEATGVQIPDASRARRWEP